MMEIRIDDAHFALGNHSFWVRAAGPNGYSAPLHVELNVQEELSGKGGGSDGAPGFTSATMIGAILMTLLIMRRRKE